MILSLILIVGLQYVNGVVASLQGSPVFWSEVACRAKMDGKQLKSPDDPEAAAFIKKRVYDRMIVDYHRLMRGKVPQDKCALVRLEAKLTLDWLRNQQAVWKDKSEASLKQLIEQLEQQYEVSWR